MNSITGRLKRATRRWQSCIRVVSRSWLRADGTDGAPRRAARVSYHLGRGRRLRERGRYDAAAREASRALSYNPSDPWAHALLGQCLAHRKRVDLDGAQRALERAWALSPANGYFLRLLLEVLDRRGDTAARADVLAWAWWSGAPVERWVGPYGPPMPARRDADPDPVRETVHRTATRPMLVSGAVG